ncbi:PaaX family transcriptional regulator [Dactylosporangium sp. CA-092794]|uniref:PaaX family transcriptional regulator n=1 Tax=Dactylosporangium sp. CA-092794 TaxID=3239929 RepID=UPI003D92F4B5
MTAVQDEQDEYVAGIAQPRQLIVSLYGLYAREHDGWLSVASVVRLLADLGVEAQAVRSSISRLKRRNLLVAQKIDGAAGYRLSDEAASILDEGDIRIFGRHRATVKDGWVLVVFSVPESEREKRHLLRTELTRMGFGIVTPGLWIAPGHLEDAAVRVLRRLGLVDNAVIFAADHRGFEDLTAAVATWWDLDALQDLYGEFLDRNSPIRDGWTAYPGRPEPRKAFRDYLTILTEWRRLPYADPGLPAELLPPDWRAQDASELFTWVRRKLAGPAASYARSVIGR